MKRSASTDSERVRMGLPGVEDISAEGPQQRHEIGDHGIAGRGAHDVAIHFLAGADGFRGVEHLVPGVRRGEPVFREKVFAIKEKLRVADVGQGEQRPGAILADVYARGNEIGIGGTGQGREIRIRGHEGKPRVVEHDDVVSAGAARKIELLLLEQVGVGKLDHFDMNAARGAPFAGGELERGALDARVDGDGEGWLGGVGAGEETEDRSQEPEDTHSGCWRPALDFPTGWQRIEFIASDRRSKTPCARLLYNDRAMGAGRADWRAPWEDYMGPGRRLSRWGAMRAIRRGWGP